MISRLDRLQGRDIYENTALAKLNEVIDAVNTQQDIIRQIGEWGSSKGECLWCENLTEVNLDDPYAEQRKWIGKLCKFWDIDNNNLYYGPLTKIHDTSPYCYECNHKMCYAFCEPVKDDVIYKGGDNE